MKIKKQIYCLLLSLTLASCVTPKQNLENLQNGTVAAVISGCTLKYRTNNYILKDTDEVTSCSVGWGSNREVRFDGYTDINFVRPGTYEFKSFMGSFNSSHYSYTRTDSPSMFSNFSVQGGEVIYIGHLGVDARDSRRILRAFNYFDRHEMAVNLLNKKYPSLVDKLEKRQVEMKEEAKLVRDLVPFLE